MADVIDYTILGDDMQIVELNLILRRCSCRSRRNDVYGRSIIMETGTGGGIFKGLRRMFTAMDSLSVPSTIRLQ